MEPEFTEAQIASMQRYLQSLANYAKSMERWDEEYRRPKNRQDYFGGEVVTQERATLKGPFYFAERIERILAENSPIDEEAIIDKTLDTIATPEMTKEQWVEYFKSMGLFSDD